MSLADSVAQRPLRSVTRVSTALAGLLAISISASAARAAEPLWTGWDVSIYGGAGLIGGDRNVFSQDTTISTSPPGIGQNDREIGANTAINVGANAAYRWGNWGIGIGYRAGLAVEDKEYSNLRFNSATSVTIPVFPGVLDIPSIPIYGGILPIGLTSASRSPRTPTTRRPRRAATSSTTPIASPSRRWATRNTP